MVQIITVDSGSGGLCIKKTDDFIILIFPSLATGQQGCVCVCEIVHRTELCALGL